MKLILKACHKHMAMAEGVDLLINVVRFSDLLFILVSLGTKESVCFCYRICFMASGVYYLSFFNPDDIIYCPMPLYHSAGCCVSVGQALIFGCTVALRTKFSASAYFPDCIKFKATVSSKIIQVEFLSF